MVRLNDHARSARIVIGIWPWIRPPKNANLCILTLTITLVSNSDCNSLSSVSFGCIFDYTVGVI